MPSEVSDHLGEEHPKNHLLQQIMIVVFFLIWGLDSFIFLFTTFLRNIISIPFHVIMQGLTNVVADGNILRLVERFLKAGVMEDGVIHPTTVGTPQGGVLSPLLANIALNFLDWHLDELGFRFVRYADDFVVLCRTERQAKEAWHAVEQFVTERLGLTLSQEKTHVTKFKHGFTFLGFHVQSHSVKMRAKSVEKFKTRVRELTRRSHNLDAEHVKKLNAVVRGVARCFATPFSTCRTQFRELDCWLRMRLRCMKTKRKSWNDNWRYKIKHIRRWNVVYLSDFLCSNRMVSSKMSLARGNSV